MYLSELTDRGSTLALVNTISFHQAKLGVIAENIANAQTPGFRAKHLDTSLFQRSLGEALERRGGDFRKPFVVRGGKQAQTGRDGTLRVTPTEKPVDQILFHDGTNLSIEKEMAELAKTGMAHEAAVTLLNGKYEDLRKAIRGQV